MASDVFIVPFNNDGTAKFQLTLNVYAGDIHESDNCLDLGTRGTIALRRPIKFIASIRARFRLVLLIIRHNGLRKPRRTFGLEINDSLNIPT